MRRGISRKGCLCFCYNDIFDPGQVCKNKQLKVMLLEEGITDSRGRVVENEDEIWWRVEIMSIERVFCNCRRFINYIHLMSCGRKELVDVPIVSCLIVSQ